MGVEEGQLVFVWCSNNWYWCGGLAIDMSVVE